jgi:hypothetical protein
MVETSGRAGAKESADFFRRFPIGHAATRTACCSSLQKQTPH